MTIFHFRPERPKKLDEDVKKERILKLDDRLTVKETFETSSLSYFLPRNLFKYCDELREVSQNGLVL